MEDFILMVLILDLVVFPLVLIAVLYLSRPTRKGLFDYALLQQNEERLGTRRDAAISEIRDIIPGEYKLCVN